METFWWPEELSKPPKPDFVESLFFNAGASGSKSDLHHTRCSLSSHVYTVGVAQMIAFWDHTSPALGVTHHQPSGSHTTSPRGHTSPVLGVTHHQSLGSHITSPRVYRFGCLLWFSFVLWSFLETASSYAVFIFVPSRNACVLYRMWLLLWLLVSQYVIAKTYRNK